MATGIPARLTAREGRRFGLSVGGAFLAFAAVAWWRGRPTGAVVLGAAGILLLSGGLVVPARLGPVYRGWMGLALLLSKLTTPIFMGVVYFGVLTPVGVILRLLGKRPLGTAGRTEGVWVHRAPGKRRSDLLRQF